MADLMGSWGRGGERDGGGEWGVGLKGVERWDRKTVVETMGHTERGSADPGRLSLSNWHGIGFLEFTVI